MCFKRVIVKISTTVLFYMTALQSIVVDNPLSSYSCVDCLAVECCSASTLHLAFVWVKIQVPFTPPVLHSL